MYKKLLFVICCLGMTIQQSCAMGPVDRNELIILRRTKFNKTLALKSLEKIYKVKNDLEYAAILFASTGGIALLNLIYLCINNECRCGLESSLPIIALSAVGFFITLRRKNEIQ